MKLSVLFLFCSLGLAQAAESYAQKTKISIEVTEQKVGEILEQIMNQTDFDFFYNNAHVDLNRRVTVSVNEEDVFEVLEQIFDGTNVSYSVLDKKIILSAELKKSNQKTITVKGKIVDAYGESVIGATVLEKGTNNGTVSDMDGNFNFNVNSSDAILDISYIGYKSQQVKVKIGTVMQITLLEDNQALDEVVVVGYGSQKKVNVIGSISAVTSDVLEARATADVSNMLTGQMSGVTIIQNSGNPGDDAGTIRVRGVGSFGATPNPLVLVDGLPGSLSDLTPSEIENISVLKDASSAAIYGSRAANGVILVTTKKGKAGKARITYNGSVGWSQATALPELATSAEYAEYFNMAIGKENYTPEMIQKFKDGSDPDNYANEQYLDDLLGGHAFQTKHELSVNGGSEKMQYMVSLGYLRQNGLLENNYFNKYNARVNLGADLTDKLRFNVNIAGMVSDRHEPSTPGSMDATGVKGIISNAVRFPGLYPTKMQNGEWGLGPKLMGTPVAWQYCNSE